jgi:EmrB/QacA subfamily drug resistance transporter
MGVVFHLASMAGFGFFGLAAGASRRNKVDMGQELMQRTGTGKPAVRTEARTYTHAERMRVVTGILLCIMLAALDQTVVLPAIPQMAATLHGAGHLSWVVAAYLLTSTATTPIYGKLSDQLGRRQVLAPAIILFMLAAILCALAQSVLQLIAARALLGIGGGALLAVPQAAVADVIPPRERGRYQAWFAGVWAFSSVAGPIAGGLVTQNLSWRWIFWVNLPLGLVALALSARGLKGLRAAGGRERIDYAGAVLLMLGVAAVLLALSSGGVDVPWTSPAMLGIVAAALGLLALLVIQQRRAAAPLLPGALLATAGFRAVLWIAFLNAAALFGAIFLLPLLLGWVFHASAGASGLDIVPFLFTTTLGAFAAGQITRRTGRTQRLMAAGLGLASVTFLPMAVIPMSGAPALPVAISALFGVGIGMIMPSSLVTAQSQAPHAQVGAATGTLLLARAMGGAFGATVAGAVLALAHGNLIAGFRLGFLACAASQAVAAIVALQMENIPLRTTLDTARAAE